MAYSGYRGKSIGRMIHYIHKYCGLHYAENVMFGENGITYLSRPFATVEWRNTRHKSVQVPWFTFSKEHERLNGEQSRKKFEVMDKDISEELAQQLDDAKKLLLRVGVMVIDKGDFRSRIIMSDVQTFLKDTMLEEQQ